MHYVDVMISAITDMNDKPKQSEKYVFERKNTNNIVGITNSFTCQTLYFNDYIFPWLRHIINHNF